MTSELFVKVVMCVATLLAMIITGYVIPFLESKMSQTQIDQLSYYISVAVRCAEQIYTPEQWKQKKIYVVNYIKGLIEAGFKITLSDEQIDTIIEGIVNEIKHGDSNAE